MSLKSLQSAWYQKLKEVGFEDIETSFQFHSSYFRDIAPKLMLEKEAYFHKASSFLNDFEFCSQLEKDVWEMHSRGDTIREISRALSISVGSTQGIVSKLRDVMLKAIL